MSHSSPLTRWDAVKIIAVLLMFVDHAGAFYYTDAQWIRGIGRACAPIFFFLAGFAPHYRTNRKLIIFALLLTASDWMVKGAPNTLNILWSIVFIRLLFAWLERQGSFKLRLHEWFIGSAAMLLTQAVLQYGPFGALIGLCGYTFKHRARYAPDTPRRFLLLVVIFYGIICAWFSQFTPMTTVLMALSLAWMMAALLWFSQGPMTPVPLPRWLKPLSRYTAEIYVVHLLVLGWLTGKAI